MNFVKMNAEITLHIRPHDLTVVSESKREGCTQPWFGLVSLFNGLSTFMGYLMPKSSL